MEIDCIDRGDLWKYKFRALQLRIRDRFRVTVDKHRHRHRYPTSSDGYVSMKIERWVNQFRHLRRRDSSVKPTSVFYRKRGVKNVISCGINCLNSDISRKYCKEQIRLLGCAWFAAWECILQADAIALSCNALLAMHQCNGDWFAPPQASANHY
ncbi:hypothetical protein GIB67_015101 [Kingdonia uniflora]|uniref:Uncharacterized protein n=1 Tax=Kingdonia uniflora TaxID=39325 RepID=A0A7J7LIX9_9MAGN|nr:hypothetical protein GIB67_015101 [Kingdonia uniflora]